MKRIAFFELEPWEKEHLRRKLRGFKLDFFDGTLEKKDWGKIRLADALVVFIYSPVPAAIIKAAPKLRLVSTMSTGFDHVDVAGLRKKGVTVCNVPEYGSNTVAEHTFALLLNISRHVFASLEHTKRGNFSRDGLRGFDLAGKTIGIIGFGKIGRHVARIAQGFGMRVLAFDPFLSAKEAKKAGVRSVSLSAMLRQSDVISLHAPLTEKTRHTINTKNIRLVKKGAILINTARGPLVQTHAILEGLKTGRLSAVGLDVLEEECAVHEEKQLLSEAFQRQCDMQTILEQHVLQAQENVFITPHNAFNSQEALERILDTTVENIKVYFAGKPKNGVCEPGKSK